ncbi:MAG: protoporphyrinogen oxidase [Dehalobacterium sp.]|jgi:oxygen-dependent protoporphyrinogen oxidase
MKKVVIVGGGIAGLAAAYTLQESKEEIEYTLIEKSSRLGGKIQTKYDDGFVIEEGPDCVISTKPPVIQLVEKIGLTPRLIGTNDERKGTYIYSGKRLHVLPEGLMMLVPTKIVPFALSPLISWPGKFRMAFDLVLPRKKEQEDETLYSFVVRRLGHEAMEKIAEPLIGGIHGGAPETMSLKACFPIFLDMERNHRSLVKAMLVGRRKAKKRKPISRQGIPKSHFISLKGGMGELVAALEQKLEGQVLKGQEVTKITSLANGYRVEVAGGGELFADGVILAIPAPQASVLLENIDSQGAKILQATPMASSATISFAYKSREVPQANSFGALIPFAEQTKINAVTFTSVKWNHRVPNEEYTLIRVFFGGAKKSQYATEPDEQLLDWAQEELKSILGITAIPERHWIQRWIEARPQYTIGHLERMQELEERLAKSPGLVVVGGSYRGIGVPDCVKDGVNGAKEIITYLAK